MKCPKYNPTTNTCCIQTNDVQYRDESGGVKVSKAECKSPETYQNCTRFVNYRDAGRLGKDNKSRPKTADDWKRENEKFARKVKDKAIGSKKPDPKVKRLRKKVESLNLKPMEIDK